METTETIIRQCYQVKQGYVFHLGGRKLAQPGDLLEGVAPDLLESQKWKIDPVIVLKKAGPVPPPLPQKFPHYLKDGSWKGRRCFILGGGPSLKEIDLSRLRGELTIGINRALELIDPTMIFSMDARFYGWLMAGEFGSEVTRKYRKSAAWKIWMDTHGYLFGPEVQTIPCPLQAANLSVETGIARGTNSGLLALKVALALGASPIYLMGFDMHHEGGRQKWWHDGYKIVQKDEVYSCFLQEMEAFSHISERNGARIINVNPDSAVQCFEFGELPEPDPGPLFVSFYTPGLYEQKAKDLILSLHRMGLDYEVDRVEDLGSWQSNTIFKAEFIKRKMEQNPTRNIVWLDADAVIRQYPHLFWEIEGDFAANYFRGWQLSSGTVFFKGNRRAKLLVNAWIKENKKNPEIWDQQNLQTVVEQRERSQHLSVTRLPAEYYLTDMVRGASDPVIEHTQASRQARVLELNSKVSDSLSIASKEASKYAQAWGSKQYRRISPGLNVALEALTFFKSAGLRPPGDTLIDYGCGTGRAAKFFMENGLKACGIDICAAALEEQLDAFIEAPLWDLPFDAPFTDFAFCVDVLEHIPEQKLEMTVWGIKTHTRKAGFIQVAHFPHEFEGQELHLTIKPNEWWVKFLQDKLPGFTVYRGDPRRSIYTFRV